MIYLDNAATTPMTSAMTIRTAKYLHDYYGNPATLYTPGSDSKQAIDNAKEKIAKIINCKSDEIYFTSGGTESDNWALRGVIEPGDHIITSTFEHPAILNTCKYLEDCGYEVTYVNPDGNGFVTLKSIMEARKENTKLISIMLVNNEIGTIQKIKEIGEWARFNGVLMHTDAVQAVGHIPVDVNDLCVDMLSASGHKFGALKGSGFLYVRNGVNINPLIFGGKQQNGLRAGTQDAVSALVMADALETSIREMRNPKMERLKDIIIDKMLGVNGVSLNGSPTNRVDSNINLCIKGCDSQSLIIFLNEEGICVSAGSACASGEPEPSHVLKAIGMSDEDANNSIRITLGYQTSFEEVNTFIEKLKYYINLMRQE